MQIPYKYIITVLLFMWMVLPTIAQDCQGPLSVTMVGATTNEPITIEHETSMVYCTDAFDGNASVTVYGGTPDYKYEWNYQNRTSAVLEDLPAGSYMVTVTDNNGCTEEGTITIVTMDPLLDSLILVDHDACGTCYLNDGNQSYFYYEDEYIGAVLDLTTDKDIGETTVCADLEEETQFCFGQPALPRRWTFESDSVEQSNVRLFFTEKELELFAVVSGYSDVTQFVNSGTIFLKIYDTEFTDCNVYAPKNELYTDFTITQYDEEEKVWSVEIKDIDDAQIIMSSRSQVLPVDLLSFNGVVMDKYNHLLWSTANENNALGFQVEKSRNGLDFDSLGYVGAKNIAQADYTFNDIQPWTGSNYYKLKQLDIDGNYKYSHIIHLQRENTFTFDVIENPFSHTLFLHIDTKLDFAANISIFAINGQVVFDEEFRFEEGSSPLNLDMTDLIKGNYIVRLFNNDSKEFITKKIIKI